MDLRKTLHMIRELMSKPSRPGKKRQNLVRLCYDHVLQYNTSLKRKIWSKLCTQTCVTFLVAYATQ